MQPQPLEMTVNVNIDQLAALIQSLSGDDLELLEMKVTGESKELLSRLNDIQSGDTNLLSEEDIFDV